MKWIKFLFLIIGSMCLACSEPEEDVMKKVSCNLFKQSFEVMKGEGCTDVYAKECLDYANNLSDEIKLKLFKATILLYNNTHSEQDSPSVEFVSPPEILNHLEPRLLIVSEQESAGVLVFHMELHLDNGDSIEWLVRGGKVLYVGRFVYEYEWSPENHFNDNIYNYINRL